MTTKRPPTWNAMSEAERDAYLLGIAYAEGHAAEQREKSKARRRALWATAWTAGAFVLTFAIAAGIIAGGVATMPTVSTANYILAVGFSLLIAIGAAILTCCTYLDAADKR
jgi:hypothetical protein